MPRRRKQVKPSENVLEIHPWSRFPQSDNNALRLIIGSFPPNKFTTHKETLTDHDADFFYGSKDNEFWELFCEALGLSYEWPKDVEKLKSWLQENRWVITDIVSETKRKKNSALDSDLIEIKWNSKTIDSILLRNPILFIFFTSKWVEVNYHKNVTPLLKNSVLADETILISPSRNGLRTVKKAKFLKIAMNDGEKPNEFRKRYYRDMLNSSRTEVK